jgi:hypothetical protein
MAEGVKDKLAERIAERRALATATGSLQSAAAAIPERPYLVSDGPKTTVSTEPSEKFPSEIVFVSQLAAVIEAKSAIASGENAVHLARRLSLIVKGGVSQRDLAAALGKSKSWVSKRIGLLRAPVAVRQLIETGQLSESDYYDNQKNVLSGIKDAVGGIEYQRVQTVRIKFEAARLLALMLRDLAEKNRAAPVLIRDWGNKKQIESILNARSAELLKGMKP